MMNRPYQPASSHYPQGSNPLYPSSLQPGHSGQPPSYGSPSLSAHTYPTSGPGNSQAPIQQDAYGQQQQAFGQPLYSQPGYNRPPPAPPPNFNNYPQPSGYTQQPPGYGLVRSHRKYIKDSRHLVGELIYRITSRSLDSSRNSKDMEATRHIHPNRHQANSSMVAVQPKRQARKKSLHTDSSCKL